MNYLKILIVLVIFFVGGANATPTKIEDRTEYSTSLNSIASTIMTWYGSLINDPDTNNQLVNFNTNNTHDLWVEHRSKYPENINQIVITNTQLLKQGDDYYFTVSSNIRFNKDNKKQTHSRKELFIFSNSILKQASNISPSIKSIELMDDKKILLSKRAGYDRKHYKVREFVYAWLAYMDGVSALKSSMNADTWLDTASYYLKIGNKKMQGSIDTTLKNKKKYLATGGHLLRSLSLNKLKEDGTFVIDLIIEWKGVNPSGKPVVAKIHQEITVKVQPDNSWQVLSIHEEHLLPVIAPWMGLLC